MLALWIMLVTLTYLTAGRTYGKLSWDTWKNCDAKSLRAKFFFPLSSEDPEGFGLYGALAAGYHPFIEAFGDNPKEQKTYATVTAFTWPIFLGFSLVTLVFKWPIRLALQIGKIVFIRLPEAIADVPSMIASTVRRSLKARDETSVLPTASEPSPPYTLPQAPDAAGPEREYLSVIRRRQELLSEMDALSLREAEAIAKIGGPDEAKKLAALPGKIL